MGGTVTPEVPDASKHVTSSTFMSVDSLKVLCCQFLDLRRRLLVVPSQVDIQIK